MRHDLPAEWVDWHWAAGLDGQRSGLRARRVTAGLRGERGAGTVLVIILLAVTLTASSAVLVVGGAAVAQRRAATAADAAALAAADIASGRVVPSGGGTPCSVASTVASANGATVRECALEEVVVAVTTVVGYAGLDVIARARAGPPGAP